MESIFIILIAGTIFFSIALWLAVDAEHVSQWMEIAFLIAIMGGLGIYGTINSNIYGAQPISAVLRTVVDLGRMFGNPGGDNYEKFTRIVGTSPVFTTFFWTIHFFAYYALVSAIVLFIGKDVLRRLRMFLLRIRDVEIIYGINEHTIEIGRELLKNGKTSVAFIGNGTDYDATIRKMGGVWFPDNAEAVPTKKFLKKFSIKRNDGKVRLSALSDNEDLNYDYALKMMYALKALNIDPSQSELVLLGHEDIESNNLQAVGDKYGFGSTYTFNKSELTARMLLRKYPVSDTVNFDTNGKAENNVDIVIIGFGHVGQELLKRIVACGQFEGSNFQVKVFDPDISKKDGFFKEQYAEMLSNYDISFEPYDGRSSMLTDYVKNNSDAITSVYIAVGNETAGREMAYGIIDIMMKNGRYAPVFQCCVDKVILYKNDMRSEITKTFEPAIIYGRSLDKLAKEINHFYRGDSESADEQWNNCTYFDRMSCRASADYLSGLLRQVGLTAFEKPGDECMENLAKSEHKRWCAFHYSMGYKCMTKEEIGKRADLYRNDNTIRITKDNKNKLHACLIPWDELDELSSYENSVTGKNVDYKQMDRDNIVTMINLICK
ncbi:hypothetical protein [Butyrivibrio sp. VCD2006]|uniref:hypothetical protein n=1 Tax=Butyrivibrio sp. VCD2006 TaxID=1280664 RepID=UPI000402F270|nr:hypothetical protein [Butyrivibrio sp. VCD2006]